MSTKSKCAWGVVVLIVLPSIARAARAIDTEIVLLGGRVVLTWDKLDSGTADVDTVWRYLKDAQFGGERGFRIIPDKDNPLRATLEGDIIVRIRYGGSAKVNRLIMMREKDASAWRIEPAQIENLLKTRYKNWR